MLVLTFVSILTLLFKLLFLVLAIKPVSIYSFPASIVILLLPISLNSILFFILLMSTLKIKIENFKLGNYEDKRKI